MYEAQRLRVYLYPDNWTVGTGWLMVGIGLGLIVLAGKLFVDTYRLAQVLQPLNATIVELKKQWDSESDEYTYAPVLRIELDDEVIDGTFRGGGYASAGKYIVGQELKIFVDPSRPRATMSQSRLSGYFLPSMVSIFGLAFLFFGTLQFIEPS